MKKVYEKPLIGIEEFEVEEDILTLSSAPGGISIGSDYGVINS